MYMIIEKIAGGNDLPPEKVHCIYTAIVGHLLSNVPELEKMIDTVFTDPEPENIRKEINKLINLLQYRGMEHLKNFTMPELVHRVRLNNDLL